MKSNLKYLWNNISILYIKNNIDLRKTIQIIDNKTGLIIIDSIDDYYDCRIYDINYNIYSFKIGIEHKLSEKNSGYYFECINGLRIDDILFKLRHVFRDDVLSDLLQTSH